jgi:hypothetical protein
MNIPIKLGDTINNDQLTSIFLCSPQGGMRRSLRTNTLVLVSDRTGLYQDRTEGDIFLYTGMGQTGDQQLNSQNKTLAESTSSGVSVHFFEVFKPKEYTYQGEVVLAGQPFQEDQRDINGNMRKVWIFPLRRLHGTNDNDQEFILEIEQLEAELGADETIEKTEKERIVKSRIGQSKFKQKLLSQSKQCALCGVNDERFLIASHIKPWSQSTNEERLDVNNGLLLCPNHDALFDKGFISFDGDGKIVISDEMSEAVRVFMNVNPQLRVEISEQKSGYLNYHFRNLFKL